MLKEKTRNKRKKTCKTVKKTAAEGKRTTKFSPFFLFRLFGFSIIFWFVCFSLSPYALRSCSPCALFCCRLTFFVLPAVACVLPCFARQCLFLWAHAMSNNQERNETRNARLNDTSGNENEQGGLTHKRNTQNQRGREHRLKQSNFLLVFSVLTLTVCFAVFRARASLVSLHRRFSSVCIFVAARRVLRGPTQRLGLPLVVPRHSFSFWIVFVCCTLAARSVVDSFFNSRTPRLARCMKVDSTRSHPHKPIAHLSNWKYKHWTLPLQKRIQPTGDTMSINLTQTVFVNSS